MSKTRLGRGGCHLRARPPECPAPGQQAHRPQGDPHLLGEGLVESVQGLGMFVTRQDQAPHSLNAAILPEPC